MDKQPCRISSCWVLCGSGSRTHWGWGGGGQQLEWPEGTRYFATWIRHWAAMHSAKPMPSCCVCQWTQARQLHYGYNSHQRPDFCGPSVRRYRKYHHHLGILGEFLFLCSRLCRPGCMLCHMLGVNVGRFWLLGLRQHASLFQGIVGFEPCTLLLYIFAHLSIPPPPPGFKSPLSCVSHHWKKLWHKF